MQSTECLKRIYEFGSFRIDDREKLLLKDDCPIPLSPKAFELLLVLVQNNGHLLEKNDLLQMVWPDSFVEESNLSHNIYLLRKIFGEGPDTHGYIETIPKRGYRFTADIREVNSGNGRDMDIRPTWTLPTLEEEEKEERSGALETGKMEQVTALVTDGVTVPQAKRNFRSYALFLSAISLVIGLGGFWVFRARRSNALVKPRKVAVLPFRQLGVGSNDELLGLGMADTIITKLCRLPDLTVLPTSSVSRYTARERDPVAIGRDLGVDAVLDGTEQNTGNRVRVTVQMVRTSDGKTTWSDKFDTEFTELLALQDSISEEMAQALSIQLGGDEKRLLSKRYTNNPDAYQSYLMGAFFWNKRSKEGISKAIEYFQQAIERDPQYALAYAQLADSYYLSVYYHYHLLPSKEAFEKAKAAVARALELDGELAEAYTSLAMVQCSYERDMAGAEKSIELATRLNPTYATAHLRYGWFLAYRDRLDDALKEMQRSQELDPLSPASNAALAGILRFKHDFDQALKYDQRASELSPNDSLILLNLGNDYENKGMYAEALTAYQKIQDADDDSTTRLEAIGHVYAMQGIRKNAEEVLKKLASPDNSKKVSATNVALIYTALGDNDLAFKWLNKAAAEKTLLPLDARYEPQFDALRTDPRFKDLVRRYSYLTT